MDSKPQQTTKRAINARQRPWAWLSLVLCVATTAVTAVAVRVALRGVSPGPAAVTAVAFLCSASVMWQRPRRDEFVRAYAGFFATGGVAGALAHIFALSGMAQWATYATAVAIMLPAFMCMSLMFVSF
jgi:hypothetical protein